MEEGRGSGSLSATLITTTDDEVTATSNSHHSTHSIDTSRKATNALSSQSASHSITKEPNRASAADTADTRGELRGGGARGRASSEKLQRRKHKYGHQVSRLCTEMRGRTQSDPRRPSARSHESFV